MRIAMIGTRGLGSNYGGIERCLDELCPYLALMGHEVDVFSEFPAPHALPAGLRAIPVRTIGGKHFSNLSRSAFATLQASGKYDVIHFHATGPSSLSMLTSLARQPSVVTIHALDQGRAKWGLAARLALTIAEKSAVSFADEVTVVSESLRRYFREKYDLSATCLPNGLPKKTRQPAGRFLASHGLAEQGYLLFASRLTPEKGCHDLIDAFNRSATPLKLAIAGGHSTDQYLQQLKAKADPRRTVFLGHLNGLELVETFSNAHAFVLPSYVEGMSIALLEAIAYRLPVVVSDIPENMLVVGKASCTFPAGDVDALTAQIDALTTSADALAERTVDSERFADWQTLARRYDAIYARAVARRAVKIEAGT